MDNVRDVGTVTSAEWEPPTLRSGGTDPNALNIDAMSLGSGSYASSQQSSKVPNELELCPQDGECPLINEKSHQRKFAHTCRLFPCYHAHIRYHQKCFRHAPGQEVVELASTASQSMRRRKRVPGATFPYISTSAANAVEITISYAKKDYKISGDWTQVRVHTFKRYLHQVTSVTPNLVALAVVMGDGSLLPMDDDTANVSDYQVRLGSRLVVTDLSAQYGEKMWIPGASPSSTPNASPKHAPAPAVAEPKPMEHVKPGIDDL